MTAHDALMRVLGAAVFAVVTTGGVIVGVLESTDPTAIATWIGSSGAIGFVAWRVWSDSRAMDSVQQTLRDQIEALTEERDEWRTRAETANAQVLKLSIELAKNRPQPPPRSKR